MSLVLNGSTGLITNSGTVISASTIGVGGATPSASGAGISFPATQNASSDANTLDDYEEGTWTPTITGSISGSKTPASNNVGWYVKIGNVVHVGATVDWSGGTSIVGNVCVSGLPFVANSSSNKRGWGSAGTNNGLTITSGNWIIAGIDFNNSFAYLVVNTPNASYNITPTVSATGTLYGFGLTYQTNT